MKTAIENTLNVYQEQITTLAVRGIVQDALIKAIINSLPEDAKPYIHKIVKESLDVDSIDFNREKMLAIAQTYLEQVFHIK